VSQLSDCNPTGRFTGLAEGYARHRPGYPQEALDWLLARGVLPPGALVADIGSGTGISSRFLAAQGLRVVGIEPNAEMRERAQGEPGDAGQFPVEYRAGRAEATGLPDGGVQVVLAAQAFHWFEAAKALAEFHRILRPGGWVLLLWNERDESNPFTAAFGDAFRAVPGAAELEAARASAGVPLLTCPLFTRTERVNFRHEQEVDGPGLLGRAFSASYAPREPAAVAAFTAALTELFDEHQQQGKVILRYVTSLWVGQRPQAI
jgi:SAM-dependent methyltransferase